MTGAQPELLPCPHCGKPAKYFDTSNSFPTAPTVWCPGCGAAVSRDYDHGAGYCLAKEAVIAAWNTRI